MQSLFFDGTIVRNNITYLIFSNAPDCDSLIKIEVPVDKNTADRIMKAIATIIPPFPKTLERGNEENSE